MGGMRRPDQSLHHNPRYAQVGRALQAALLPIVERSRGDHGQLQALRNAKTDEQAAARAAAGVSKELVLAARNAWFSVLGHPESHTENGPSPAAMQAWGTACDDLDAATYLPEWLRKGAPQGNSEVPRVSHSVGD